MNELFKELIVEPKEGYSCEEILKELPVKFKLRGISMYGEDANGVAYITLMFDSGMYTLEVTFFGEGLYDQFGYRIKNVYEALLKLSGRIPQFHCPRFRFQLSEDLFQKISSLPFWREN